MLLFWNFSPFLFNSRFSIDKECGRSCADFSNSTHLDFQFDTHLGCKYAVLTKSPTNYVNIQYSVTMLCKHFSIVWPIANVLSM